MEVDEFVVSNVLCFLRHKFGKIANKLLKTALVDFYSAEDIASAKKLLTHHVHKRLSCLIYRNVVTVLTA